MEVGWPVSRRKTSSKTWGGALEGGGCWVSGFEPDALA